MLKKNLIMENKYYTPDLEDLFVGYECEIDEPVFDNTEDYMEWVEIDIDEDFNFQDYYNCKRIRTPYLTKEQIENEGFVGIFIKFRNTTKENYILGFSKKFEDFILCIHLDTKHNILKIIKETRVLIDELEEINEDTLFKGKVKSINEFKKVIKMVIQ